MSKFTPKKFYKIDLSGLNDKPMTIVNDDSRVVNKLEASLTDNTRAIIYDRHMFIVQATGVTGSGNFFGVIYTPWRHSPSQNGAVV